MRILFDLSNRVSGIIAAGVLSVTCCVAQQPQPPGRQSRTAIEHSLPPMHGERLKATLVEVSYAPGASSPVHTHSCPVIGYVIEGAIRFQVNDGTEAVYRAGDSFYEAPHSIHKVSANASKTEPAKFVAYFVCDGDEPLTSPVPKETR